MAGRIAEGIHFRRLENCPDCGAPHYDNKPEPIHFRESRPRWQPL